MDFTKKVHFSSPTAHVIAPYRDHAHSCLLPPPHCRSPQPHPVMDSFLAAAAALLLFLTSLSSIPAGIFADFPAEESTAHSTLGDQSDFFERVVLERVNREVVDGSGSGLVVTPPEDEISNCSYSLSVSPFSVIAPSLSSLVQSCTKMELRNGESYNFTITFPSSSSFSTYTGDSMKIFADHFTIGESYSLNVSSNCSTCAYTSVTFSLSLSLLNYTRRLLPFGRGLLQDEELTDVDDEAATAVAGGDKPIPVFDGKYQKIYISSNGLVTFNRPYVNWQPIPFPYAQSLIPILAPLWVDFDVQSSEGSALFYHIYTSAGGNRARNVLKIASERVRDLTGEDFEGSWVLIATWSNVIPYMSNNTGSTATFQLVLVTNYSSTYSLYLYNSTSSLPSGPSLSTVAGYTAADFTHYHNIDAAPVTLDVAVGNGGTVGQWVFNVGPATTPTNEGEESCLAWAREEEVSGDDWLSDISLTCPCSRSQAVNDWRFNFANSSGPNCGIAIVTGSQHGLECCYDTVGALVVGTADGGSYHYHHSLFYPRQHSVSDSVPFTKCCVQSSNCYLYYRYRPASDCTGYQPPAPGFLWGDPHFETLDGINYTFNGIGEYQLINSSTNGLNSQIRLERLTGTSATVLRSFAVKSYQSQLVQVEVNSVRSFVLYIGSSEHTNLPRDGEFLVVTETDTHDDAHLSSVDPTHKNNVFILSVGETMIISTGSGAVFTIGKQDTFMYVGVELGPGFLGSTEGLLGYYDDDSSNDYLLPNGTVLSTGLSEEQLYYEYGLEWHVTEVQSIFHYHSQYSYADYNNLATPTFGLGSLEGNATLHAIAMATCGEDYGCLYDTGQTGNVLLGLSTRNIRENNQRIRGNLVNFPPVITGARSVVVTVGDGPTVVQYSTEDPNNNNNGTGATLRLMDSALVGVQLNSTGHLLLDLSSLPSSPLYLSSTDTTNLTTLLRVLVLLCQCSNNGTCDIDNDDFSQLPLNNDGHFRLLCSCPLGFAGDYCDVDLRGCGQGTNPCPTYSRCYEVSGEYRCGSCADGYTLDTDLKCVDINECSPDADNNCSQVCVNNDGGFSCSCYEGYRLGNDRISCEDIDECAEMTDDCEQTCTNTLGSYQCSCLSKWILRNENNCTAAGSCGGPNDLGLCAPVLDISGCSFDGSGAECLCLNGYYFAYPFCTACPEDHYGFTCNRTCDCHNNGTCDHVTGCICTDSWTGYDCNTEINSNSPSFASGTVSTLSLTRLLPGDTPILVLSASDPDPGSTGNVSYHVVPSPHVLPPNTSDGTSVFSIDEETGVLSSVKPLSSQPYSTYLLHLVARDGGISPKSASHVIVVTVTEELLPVPRLTSPTATLTISENKAPGARIFDINCTEIDSINSRFTVLTLAITGGNVNNTFSLYGSSLITNRAIDYEEFEAFYLNISCTNAFSKTVSVVETIVVLNLNDNLFIFSSPTYTEHVYENVTNGHQLVTVTAADADKVNAVIRYSLTDPNKYGGLFSINDSTGVVSAVSVLPTPFDRETRDNYTFNVTASIYDDDDGIVESTQARIDVLILDVNDFVPLFSRSLYTSNNLSQINAFPDTVLYVSAIDRDLSYSGAISYSIQSNPHFDVNSVTGEVYVKTANISKGNYLLTINASDNGTSPLTGSTKIDIFVRPTPEELLFSTRYYSFSVPESVGPGSTVGSVKATLYDIFNVSIEEGSAAEAIEYRIIGSEPFHVTSAGHVISTGVLDYETQYSYYLQVTATLVDFSSVATATATIQIFLVDVNDHHPVFRPSVYNGLIYEDELVGTEVLKVSATDQDQNGFQCIIYSIEDDSDVPFTIESTTGILSLSSRLASAQDYHFKVVATDTGLEPVLSSIATVHISVSRRLAVKPVLNSTLYVFSLSESPGSTPFTIGSVGGVVEGNRSISTEEDGVAYRIKMPGFQPPVPIPFTVDAVTGAVNVSFPFVFDYESQDEFLFYVELYSTTENDTIFDTSPIIVKIRDENDNVPIFTSSANEAVIPLATPPGTSILTVSATDDDSGSNGGIVYYLSSSHLGFHVDRLTGVVTTTNTTMRSGDYHMTVTASDRGNPIQDASLNITITVLPTPSSFVIFSETKYNFSVPENSPVSTFVGRVVVTQIVNQTFGAKDIIFSFKSPQSCFSIGSTSGNINVSCSSQLDREMSSFHDLVVVATAPNGYTAEVGVHVDISDVNDHAPSFAKETYTTVLYSNYNDSSRVILSPVVSDADTGTNGVSIFSIVSASISDLIEIDPNTGEISLIRINGSLPQGDFRFLIKATDSLNSSLSDTALLLLTIVEPSPKILSFSPSSLSFSVAENSPGGTVVGILGLITPHPVDPSEYIGNLHFEILSGDNIDYFHVIDSNATLLLVNDLLDREEAESHVILTRASFLDFHVSTSAYITIEVTDRNDNHPVFNQSLYVTTSNTTSPNGSYLTTVHASDVDDGLNALITYSLSNVTTYFHIDATSGVVSTHSSPLPEDHYKLIVIAADSGQPSLTATSVVSVTVETPLPNSISFQESSYSFSVTENSPAGSYMGTVSIEQVSPALNGLLYSFVQPSDPVLAGNLADFHLDPVSGNLSTLSLIDREAFSGGQVIVKAYLPSFQTLSATATLSLVINDVNDNTPTFDDGLYTVTVTEGSISNPLLTVSADDSDSGSNAQIKFYITGSDFDIGSNSGALTASSLDSGIYTATITAEDGGQPALTGSATLVVTVYASLPTGIGFTKSSYTVSRNESISTGSECGFVTLKPIDMSHVASIQYSVTSTTSFVAIKRPNESQLQAWLHSSSTFDYETTQSHSFTVTASITFTNTSISTATTSTSYTVQITDVNDNAPQFQNLPASGHYTGDIAENSNEGNLIVDIGAADEDSGTNAQITYSLGNDFNNRFKIGSSLGDIRTGSTPIDRETNTQFLLVVTATDGGTPPLSSTAQLLVTIDDENDNPPVLQSSNGFNYYFDEEQKSGVALFTVVANDLDSSSSLSYSRTGGSNKFNINSNGQVSSTEQLDSDEGPSEYSLRVQVTDGKYTVDQEITLHLLNVPNDNRPQFVNFPNSIRIKPNADTNITYFHATDSDNDQLSFSISGDQYIDLFKINTVTGQLQRSSSQGPLPAGEDIAVSVTVTDDSQYTLSTVSTCILVILKDLHFVKEIYNFFVSENTTVGSVVARLEISNPELDPNFDFIDDIPYFSLKKQTGYVNVILSTELNYEDQSHRSISFSVEATLEGYVDSVASVTVSVTDINDNVPVFTGVSSFTVSVDDAMIGQVNATDADSPPNANITYKLMLSDSFYIESKSGIIWRSRPLDAGVQTITVLAEDNGSPPMITSKDFVVHIEAVSSGGAVASFAVIGIMSVILIILILALAILGVFFHKKRRERAKNRDPYLDRNRDPYLDRNDDNWQLGVPHSNRKGKDFEMTSKNDDTKAYEAMFADDFVDPKVMPWTNPGYRDKESETEFPPTDEEESDFNASISTDNRLSTTELMQAERRLSKAGSQKDAPAGPISRRGRRLSEEGAGGGSNSDLDNEEYLKDYQQTSVMKPGERPIEYDIFLKKDPNARPNRPSLRSALWPHGGNNQPSLPFTSRNTSNTHL